MILDQGFARSEQNTAQLLALPGRGKLGKEDGLGAKEDLGVIEDSGIIRARISLAFSANGREDRIQEARKG